ncbi:hypothetical protein A4W93_27680 [Piscinibacter gummiphilus]|uniref:Uncharacterized protein n=1 Tax=Piscinibacter gummiphilus TaxID=946333 RepID=A0A1W6LGN6_9BURK|nr:DUF1427 family protein [Piscinibacter gummiphilus]ARN23378.1 hypothetical protein A4W93_27680 [Piscinibacter gummiphilus]ATU68082.1 DUF1427 domain-containing protein [Piscinibacter gummiphilus]GLS97387.1 hypothetical protein GCM10007918_46790 [Piscinibacter gummiphilus]
MRAYLLSLLLGVLVGLIYAWFGIRSPAPPTIALVGLLGMLIGEQTPAVLERLSTPPSSVAVVHPADAPGPDRKE